MARYESRPVLRGSTKQAVAWGRMSRAVRARRYANAERFDRATKQPGRHGGAIGRTGLLVYRTLLFGFFNLKTGQLDPSYDAIAKRANLCRKAVWTALRRLKALGLINWTRRCSDGQDGAGRFVLRQETNAYQVQPEEVWQGFKPVPESPRTPEPGTWGAPASVLDGLAQYSADRDMGLSQEAAAAALARVAETRLEIVTARLYAQMQSHAGRAVNGIQGRGF
ncbi:MAG TPA: hypothetical protein PLX84_13650 [Acidiphilium sp.]|nr:hypothetical protein [Acidiphilium sp.]